MNEYARSVCGRWPATDAQIRQLMTMPGVGVIVALTFVSAINDPFISAAIWPSGHASLRDRRGITAG
jgi:hypothetical protein